MLKTIKTPIEEELGRLLAGDIVDFVKELDTYTPCVFGNNDEIGKNNYRRLSFLILKIFIVAKNHFTKRQQQRVVEAIVYSAMSHKGIYRKDKLTPYLLHPIEVAGILIDLGIQDYKTLVAAILHDVVEDTNATHKEIGYLFGAGVKNIVYLMTRDDKEDNLIKHSKYYIIMKEEPDLNCRWRVIAIKFADRTHYFMTSKSVSKESKEEKIKETYEEFPLLYEVLSKTLLRLYERGTIKNKKHLLIPSALHNRLFDKIDRRKKVRKT